MSWVSLTELRSDIAAHLDQVRADRTDLVVTEQGREPVAILPLGELQSLRETLHLLSTPANAAHLLGSVADMEAGRGSERTLIET